MLHTGKNLDLVERNDVYGLDMILEVSSDLLDQVINRHLEILDDADNLQLLDTCKDAAALQEDQAKHYLDSTIHSIFIYSTHLSLFETKGYKRTAHHIRLEEAWLHPR